MSNYVKIVLSIQSTGGLGDMDEVTVSRSSSIENDEEMADLLEIASQSALDGILAAVDFPVAGE